MRRMSPFGLPAVACVLFAAAAGPHLCRASINVAAHPLQRLPAGLQIPENPAANGTAAGWQLVSLAKPRLASGDVDKIPRFALNYAGLLNFAIMAKIAPVNAADGGGYQLEELAIGFTKVIDGRNTVITSDTQGKLGAGLNIIGRTILAESEKRMDDAMVVARTPQLAIFDAQALMLRDGEHRQSVLRHAVWVNRDGRISTIVWMLAPNRPAVRGQPSYTIVGQPQLLPPHFVEDRVLNIKADKINALGIPAPDAIAMARPPQGTPIVLTSGLAAVAAAAKFTSESVRQLVAELNAAIQETRRRNATQAQPVGRQRPN